MYAFLSLKAFLTKKKISYLIQKRLYSEEANDSSNRFCCVSILNLDCYEPRLAHRGGSLQMDQIYFVKSNLLN